MMSRDWSKFDPFYDDLDTKELDAIERLMTGKSREGDKAILFGDRTDPDEGAPQ